MNVAAETTSMLSDRLGPVGQPHRPAPHAGAKNRAVHTDRSPFAARLATMQSQQAETSPAREAVNKLVASAFIIPALQSLRENSLAAEDGPFAPNIAQKRFGPILDQHIADEIVSATDFRLTDTILKRYESTSRALGPPSGDMAIPAHDQHISHVNTKA